MEGFAPGDVDFDMYIIENVIKGAPNTVKDKVFKGSELESAK